MRDVQLKTDGIGDIFSANAFNANHVTELQELVKSADFTLDDEAGPDTDTAMLRKTITHYATAGMYFNDAGSVNAYVLGSIGNMQSLSAYKDGTIAIFKAANTNNGASTINIDSIGVVDLISTDGNALIGGEILAGRYVICRYNSSIGDFEIVNDNTDFTTSTDTNDTYWRAFATYTVSAGSQLLFMISALNDNHQDVALVSYRTYKQGPTIRMGVDILYRSGYNGTSLFADADSFGMSRSGSDITIYVKQQILDSGDPIYYKIKRLNHIDDGGLNAFTFVNSVAASGPSDYSAGLSDKGESVYTEGFSGLGSGLVAALSELDPAPAANLTGFGTFISATVDVNATGITAALFKAADFNYEEADASASSTAPCTALALESGTGTKDVLLQGTIRNDSWSWTAGQIFLSETTGAFTQTAPSASGTVVQCVGYAISATVMYFNPSMDFGVNA